VTSARRVASLKSLASALLGGGSVTLTILALAVAFAIGAVVIATSTSYVLTAWSHSPADGLSATWHAVSAAYGALLRGSLVDPASVSAALHGGPIASAFGPLSESLVAATPLVLAGLAVTLPFKAGLLNIGGQGQATFGAIAAGFIGFHFALPAGLHVAAAILGGVAAGMAWGIVPGALKSFTGAHEVITTIMLNYVASALLIYLLSKPIFLRPGQTDAISPPVSSSARLPHLLGGSLRLHSGFLIALAAAVLAWWIITRTTIGFALRAVGLNELAARNAGIRVATTWIIAFGAAGALAGLAGAVQILGTDYSLDPGAGAGIGFLGISVALLGRGTIKGTLLAAFLFGALEAGGLQMQAATATPFHLVTVIEALVVLFIATPRLIQALFRLRRVATDGLSGLQRGW
jgi:ABC-type uncharacterized transport system permease subunit